MAEGTLIFDKETNTLSICIGKEYNTTDPSTAFMMSEEEPAATVSKNSKAKKTTVTKPWIYTGTKILAILQRKRLHFTATSLHILNEPPP